MTVRAEVTLEWADGEYHFALRGKQIEELQAKCDAGFGKIIGRVMDGEWWWSDIYETIRLSLIGGGMGAVEAKRLCDQYVDGVPLTSGPNNPLMVAQTVLIAATMGMEKLTGKKTTPPTQAG